MRRDGVAVELHDEDIKSDGIGVGVDANDGSELGDTDSDVVGVGVAVIDELAEGSDGHTC